MLNTPLFYAYNDVNGHGINPAYITAYSDRFIFDPMNRSFYYGGHIYGNHYKRSYHGEIFNDYANNVAEGPYTHASGESTEAKNRGEHAVGRYNKSNSNTVFSVGIGTSKTNRKNALDVRSNGDVHAYKDIYAGDVNVLSYITTSYNNSQNSMKAYVAATNNTIQKQIAGIENNFVKSIQGKKLYFWVGPISELPEKRYSNVIYAVILDGAEAGEIYTEE